MNVKKILSIVGLAIGVLAMAIDDKKQEMIIEEKVNKAIAERENEEEES